MFYIQFSAFFIKKDKLIHNDIHHRMYQDCTVYMYRSLRYCLSSLLCCSLFFYHQCNFFYRERFVDGKHRIDVYFTKMVNKLS